MGQGHGKEDVHQVRSTQDRNSQFERTMTFQQKNVVERSMSYITAADYQEPQKPSLFITSLERLEQITTICERGQQLSKIDHYKIVQNMIINLSTDKISKSCKQKFKDFLRSKVYDKPKFDLLARFFKLFPGSNIRFLSLDISQLIYLDHESLNEFQIQELLNFKKELFLVVKQKCPFLTPDSFLFEPIDSVLQFQSHNAKSCNYEYHLEIKNWEFFKGLDLDKLKYQNISEITVQIHNYPNQKYAIIHKLRQLCSRVFESPIIINVDLTDTINEVKDMLKVEEFIQNSVKAANPETFKNVELLFKHKANVHKLTLNFDVNGLDKFIYNPEDMKAFVQSEFEAQFKHKSQDCFQQNFSKDLLCYVEVLCLDFANFDAKQDEYMLTTFVARFLSLIAFRNLEFVQVKLDSASNLDLKGKVFQIFRENIETFNILNFSFAPLVDEDKFISDYSYFPGIIEVVGFEALGTFLKLLLRLAKHNMGNKIGLLFIRVTNCYQVVETKKLLQEVFFQQFKYLQVVCVDLTDTLVEDQSRFCQNMFQSLVLQNPAILPENFHFLPLDQLGAQEKEIEDNQFKLKLHYLLSLYQQPATSAQLRDEYLKQQSEQQQQQQQESQTKSEEENKESEESEESDTIKLIKENQENANNNNDCNLIEKRVSFVPEFQQGDAKKFKQVFPELYYQTLVSLDLVVSNIFSDDIVDFYKFILNHQFKQLRYVTVDLTPFVLNHLNEDRDEPISAQKKLVIATELYQEVIKQNQIKPHDFVFRPVTPAEKYYLKIVCEHFYCLQEFSQPEEDKKQTQEEQEEVEIEIEIEQQQKTQNILIENEHHKIEALAEVSEDKLTQVKKISIIFQDNLKEKSAQLLKDIFGKYMPKLTDIIIDLQDTSLEQQMIQTLQEEIKQVLKEKNPHFFENNCNSYIFKDKVFNKFQQSNFISQQKHSEIRIIKESNNSNNEYEIFKPANYEENLNKSTVNSQFFYPFGNSICSIVSTVPQNKVAIFNSQIQQEEKQFLLSLKFKYCEGEQQSKIGFGVCNRSLMKDMKYQIDLNNLPQNCVVGLIGQYDKIFDFFENGDESQSFKAKNDKYLLIVDPQQKKIKIQNSEKKQIVLDVPFEFENGKTDWYPFCCLSGINEIQCKELGLQNL